MANITFDAVDNCKILIMGSEVPTATEWEAYITFVRAWVAKVPRTARFCVLVFTEGTAPTTMQRQDLNLIIEPFRARAQVAVLAVSPLARGAVAALAWFNPVYRAFSHAQFDDALTWLRISGIQAAEVRKLFELLRKRLHANPSTPRPPRAP